MNNNNILNFDTIRKIAAIAKITIKDKELAAYQKDLEAILELISPINTIDTTNTEPLILQDITK